MAKIAAGIVSLTLAVGVTHLAAQTETKRQSSITDRTVTLKTQQAAQNAKKNADKEQAAANPGKSNNSITDRTVTLKDQKQGKPNSSATNQPKGPKPGITDRTVTLKKQPPAGGKPTTPQRGR